MFQVEDQKQKQNNVSSTFPEIQMVLRESTSAALENMVSFSHLVEVKTLGLKISQKFFKISCN